MPVRSNKCGTKFDLRQLFQELNNSVSDMDEALFPYAPVFP